MRVRAVLGWVAVTFVFAVAASATAQTPSTGGATNGSQGPDAQVGFARRAQLSPQEQLVEAEVILKRMQTASAGVRKQLEKARADRDVVKTLCLNDKLSQIDVAARSAQDRNASLQSAVQRGDKELAGHEFTILSVLRQRADQLTSEANQCIGQEVSFVAQTQVVTEVDPDLPAENPATYPPPVDIGGILGTVPPCVSCTGSSGSIM